MKTCPLCQRSYSDETLNYCLEDGERLVNGAQDVETDTAVLPPEKLQGEAPTRLAPVAKPQTEEHPASSAEYIANAIGRRKNAVLFGLVLVLAGVGYGLYRTFQKGSRPFSSIKITKLTNIGNATDAHISPNGEYLAAAVYEGGMFRIRNWDIKTKSFVDIVPQTEDFLSVSSFSPDSKLIYFTRSVRAMVPDLYEIPILGSVPPKRILERSGSASISRDGKKWASVRSGPGEGENSLIISNSDGSAERVIATRKGGERFLSFAPSWSPDGKVLACSVRIDGTNAKPATVSTDDGIVTPITDRTWIAVNRTAWLNDGRGIIFSASEENSIQLWLAPFPRGELRRITNDIISYGNTSLSLTADSSTIATVQVERDFSVFVTTLNDPTKGRQIAKGGSDVPMGTTFTNWTPDGRILFSTDVTGNSEIWVINPDGSGRAQLINHRAFDGNMVMAPDGRHIVFSSTRSGRMNLWRTDADGSHPVQITTGGYDLRPAITPDGRWVIYTDTATPDMRKVSINGGESAQLISGQVIDPAISSTDGVIAAAYRKIPNTPFVLAVFSADGGEPVRTFDLPTGAISSPQWSPDGRAIIYIITNAGSSALWRQPVDGGPPKQLADFSPEQLGSFSLLHDGKSIVLSRGKFTRNVVLITDTGSGEGE